MIFQWIDRIIRCANGFYMITTHHPTSWIFGLRQFLITFIVNFTCGLWIQYFIDTKCRFQFKVSPVVQWVAESVRYCFRPFFKFFPVCGIFSRTETFVYTVCTHCTPFVVVTAQPDFSQWFKLVVVSYHLRNEMTVIVDDRHFSRMLVIQLLRSFCLQQEVFVHEVLHYYCVLSI